MPQPATMGGDRASFRPSYRPERPAGGMLDADMKRLGLLAAGLGGGLALLVGLSSLFGHHHHGTPVIEADAGPVRVKPENPGGMQVTGADMSLGNGSTQVLAPAAEEPQISALRAQLHAVKAELARQQAATAQAARQGEAAAQAARVAQAEAAKVVAAPPVQRAAAFAPVASVLPPVSVPKPVPAASYGAMVQLAAFTDEKGALEGWDQLVKKTPDLLGGRKPEITTAQAAGRTIYRLRTGGFATVNDAANFCAKMRSRDADCSIAAF